MVSSSFEDYEERAVHLATNRNTALSNLRAKICANRLTMPLFDTTLWARHFEIGLVEVWRMYCQEGGRKDHVDLTQMQYYI